MEPQFLVVLVRHEIGHSHYIVEEYILKRIILPFVRRKSIKVSSYFVDEHLCCQWLEPYVVILSL